MNGSMPTGTDPRIDALIDASLRAISSATPDPGLDGRILTRLASERMNREAEAVRFPARFPLLARLGSSYRLPVRALGVLTSCLLAFVIVAGTVSHSRKLHSGETVAPPGLVLPTHGIGAASAVHPAAPASAPVPAGQGARGRATHRTGRARIAPHARKAPGVAVPAPSSDNSQN
jgi:hypothetical protein